ncbi:MAG: 1-deoxy-D-xylulose-5-phosphate synthase N-terminal domain-containing protein [Candidatus Parcubacteria bacterium]|nr:1-deoxy-D-xylulose-5-phosphate synthase N-terminal domain-containing protein [Candidatus Parcubacteria bacterium]
MKNKDLKKRIVEISYRYNKSHIGSCLSAVDIIEEIYNLKKTDEKFILSEGHAAIALYCVLEKHEERNSEDLLKKHGIHPERDEKNGIWCTTGSLGQGLPIALGMAIANKKKNIYCLISDGEAAEGSIWEALRIKTDNNIDNLKIYINLNGYGAYGKINPNTLIRRLKAFCPDINIRRTNVEQLPFLKGLNAHYHVMTRSEYSQALELLK